MLDEAWQPLGIKYPRGTNPPQLQSTLCKQDLALMQTTNNAGAWESQACVHDRYLGLVLRLSATLRDPQSHVSVVGLRPDLLATH